MKKSLLRIGTRGSALALWQARLVRDRILAHRPALTVELVSIKTTGDKILDVPLAKVGGKGLFVKELEEALLDGRADLAVHSMKDVPARFPPGLTLGSILERADPRDVVLSVHHAGLAMLPQKARVGSSSLRRCSQLLALRPDLNVLPLRGNINTRIEKMVAGEYDAIILAAAGVERLQMTRYVVEYLDSERMVSAIGQGAIGMEMRDDDPHVATLLEPLNHLPTQLCVRAERAFLATLEGGCQVPIGGHARLDGQTLTLEGIVAGVTGSPMIRGRRQGSATDPEALGVALAQELLGRGARKILQELQITAPSGGRVDLVSPVPVVPSIAPIPAIKSLSS
ncbi:MAG: hydroxymethylbilane synthase [Magnetococcales bacterium]|nr:hydroxymethylbilane synthase [Magnetococcales bacterium]MBF0322921.1 hydroxymethylbilane synthase [Magnetococcales bacterium]